MSKIWLVTGSSRGLGRNIVEAALAAGDCVVATARAPESLLALKAQYGERLQTVVLDVTSAQAAQKAVQQAVASYGRLDVLVNNAGFAHIAPLEQMPEDELRAQIETNFFGVVNLTRAVLPQMRQQGSGYIIQISSVGGRIGTAGLGAYQAAKWAVGGLTQALDQEVRPLGIKVVTVEPGGIKTDFAAQATQNAGGWSQDYDGTVGKIHDMIRHLAGHEAGDPARMAQVIVGLTRHPAPPVRLLLGSDAVALAEQAEEYRQVQDEAWRAVSLATDTLPDFPDVSRLQETDAVFRRMQQETLRTVVERQDA